MAETVLARMAVQIAANTSEFGKGLSQANASLDKFSKGVSSVAAGLGIAFSATAIFNGLSYAVGVMADFEAKMSEVKAITGATGDQFEALKQNALDLGASTRYTATQVAGLQVAYGRLGFSTKEIINATKATLDLATATGEDLAKSADVVGSTIRAFGLNAKESGRVADVMASSFNQTALGLDNFSEAMKYVAPISAAANISLEDTTALLGALADAGIRGSQAGTSLRKIITDLAKDGRPLAERLKELAKNGLSFSQANDEVGRTAYASLLVLAKATEKTDALSESFQHAEGEAAKMARTMSDNFTGDVVKLSSAFDGFILSLSNTSVIRSFTQDLAGLFTALSGGKAADLANLALYLDRLGAFIKNGISDKSRIIDNLKELRKETAQPIDSEAIDIVIEKYKLTAGEAKQLREEVEKVNQALSVDEKILKQFDDFSTRNKYTDLTKAADDYIKKINELTFAVRVEKGELSKINTDGAFDGEKERLEGKIATYEHIIEVIEKYREGLEKPINVPTIKPILAIIPALEEQIKSFQEAQKNSFSIRDISAYGIAIEGLRGKISRLIEPIKEPFVITISTSKAFSDLGLDKFNEQLLISHETVNSFMQDYINSLKEINNLTKTAKIEIGGLISNSLSSLAAALGNAAVGVGNLGHALLQAVAEFAIKFGEILIATGIGTKLLESGNAYGMIIGGAILVAAGTALSSLNKQRSQIGTGSGGGSGGGSAVTASRYGNTTNFTGSANLNNRIYLEGEFKLEGRNLVAAINAENGRQTRLG